MADPITLSNDDAAKVLRVIFDHLQRYRAIDLVHGIEESRRLGIEEDVSKEMMDREKGTGYFSIVRSSDRMLEALRAENS